MVLVTFILLMKTGYTTVDAADTEKRFVFKNSNIEFID